ncbi:MAG: efflux RND transporter permease subunit [Spirochaetia bacterium]|jgi:multidrug efflux pump subunit AcrB|nr:efflux RND transporter permease subunit [Spirochaetia bacterium]
MKLSEFSVRRPVMMTMIYLLICIIAALSVKNLKQSLFPDVDMPVISVYADCTNAGPDEIESQVAEVLEDGFSSLENLKKMTSYSESDRCFIVLEYNYGTDLDDASSDVSDIITRVSDSLPDWCATPSVMKMDMSSNTVFMRLVLSGDENQKKLLDLADNTISPLISRISGVSEVEVRGGDSVYHVELDKNRMEALGLSYSDVVSALDDQNLEGTGGTFTQGTLNYNVNINTQYTSADEILNTIVTTLDGYAVRVKDIGTVTLKKETSYKESYLDGTSVISLSVSNDSDSNESTVAKAVKAALPSIQKQLPKGVKLTIERDETKMISTTLSEVYQNAIEGILLAGLIIFLFLRGFKSTFIIMLSMPISLLITLMFMYAFDISLNMMSMSGLILGIGMIVDSSIVILENTYRYRESGMLSVESAILGSNNMGNAIVASTLTTLCVFIPLILYKTKLEMIGMMFQDLIITVCIALLASLFVAMTLVPALSGSILKLHTRKDKPLKSRVLRTIDNALARFEEKMTNAYATALKYFLHRRLLLIILLVLLTLFSLSKVSNIGMSLTPTMNSDDEISLSLTMPSGTNKKYTKQELFAIQEKIQATLPKDSYTEIMAEVGASNTGSLDISLPDISKQKYSILDLKSKIRALLNDNPNATWTFDSGRGPTSNSAIDIAISSKDMDAIQETIDNIKTILADHVPTVQNIASDLDNGAPKIEAEVNLDLANELGVTADDIYTELEFALDGIEATSLTSLDPDDSYDFYVTLDSDKFTSISDLENLTIQTSEGAVTLGTFVTFKKTTAPASITRVDKVRVNHVTADAADGYSSSQALSSVQTALDKYLLLPDGVTLSQEGDMATFTSYAPTLILIILLALFLVFAVMAAQFESLIDPFIIFATVPLLLIGVIWIHIWMGQDFTLYSIVGIIALIGVVVNNGIVMVDTINQLVRKKMPVKQACITAAKTRLRPILMTTLTTVLGMIPLAFFPGSGAEMMQPIALTFVGGLCTGAFLTLFLSPVLYSILNARKEKHYEDPKTLNNQLLAFDDKYPNGRY